MVPSSQQVQQVRARTVLVMRRSEAPGLRDRSFGTVLPMADTERVPLSRQRIAQSALELIDSVGLPGLSMRKLGAELGVEAMSLYHYVSNKDDLFDAVLDLLYDSIQLPEGLPESDWEEAIRFGLRSFYDVVREHPLSLELFVNRPGRSLSAFRVLRWSMKRFQAAGLDVLQASHAFHFCVSYVLGHAATELGSMRQLRGGMEIDTSVVDDEDFALFINISQQVTPDEAFECGLEVLITGLRATYDLQ